MSFRCFRFVHPLAFSSLALCTALILSLPPVKSQGAESSDERLVQPEPNCLFRLIDEKQVEVKFIPLNASQANLIVTNTSTNSLDIQLPKAFGAVHVLAQFGPGAGLLGGAGRQGAGLGAGQGAGGQGLLGQGGGQQGFGQNLGGGFGQGNFGQGNFGQGGQNGNGNLGRGFGRGLFRLEPDSKKKLTVTTFCLQYGRPDPRPSMKYQLVRLDVVCPKNGPQRSLIESLCQETANKGLSQPAAQALAWHLTDKLDWSEIQKIYRRRSRYTGDELMFSTKNIQTAKAWLASQTASEEQGQTLSSLSYFEQE